MDQLFGVIWEFVSGLFMQIFGPGDGRFRR